MQPYPADASLAARDVAWFRHLTEVRQYRRGERTAPHKPLLLLWALGRVARGEPRLTRWSATCGPLRQLLATFAGSFDATPHFPFQNLRSDGVWELTDYASMRLRSNKPDAPVSELNRVDPAGGFVEALHDRLVANPSLLTAVVERLLDASFPPSVHPLILNSVGWLEPPTRSTTIPIDKGARQRRDPRFRAVVLAAYDYRCAVCGMRVGRAGPTALLEAAHLKWFCFGQDNGLSNGLCLCPLHHTALDLGLISLTTSHEIDVSPAVSRGSRVVAELQMLDGRNLIGPVSPAEPVSESNIHWHRKYVFRGSSSRAG